MKNGSKHLLKIKYVLDVEQGPNLSPVGPYIARELELIANHILTSFY